MDNEFTLVEKEAEDYIRSLLNPLKDDLFSLYKKAKDKHVPVAKLEVLSALGVLFTIKRPKKVLELGSAVGISSIFLSDYLADDGFIDTVENDPKVFEVLKENIGSFGLEKVINPIFADAKDYLLNIEQKYDIIFIDAAKGQYENYFHLSRRLLEDKGIIIADNVLYKGSVAKGQDIPFKKKTLIRNLRSFLETITKDPDFETTVLPISDGLSVSVKK